MTVTAAASGGTDVCAAFAVAVLTGAAGTQNGATHNGADVPPEAAITPDATGSIVFGALLDFPGSTDLTPAAAATFSANAFGAGGCSYGTFYSTSKTASGTPVTLGASAPAGEFNNLVMAEILASGTLAMDASTPVGLTSAVAASLTTASFSPPPGALLVASAVGVSSSMSSPTPRASPG